MKTYYLSKKYYNDFFKKWAMDILVNENGHDIANYSTNYLTIKDFRKREKLKNNIKIIRI